MPTDTPPHIDAAIGATVRALREDEGRGWTQDDLAREMRRLGFRWTRSVVAALERGGKRVTAADLIGLAIAFDVPLAGLVPAGREAVALGEGSSINGRGLRKLLAGSHPNALTLREHIMPERAPDGLWEQAEAALAAWNIPTDRRGFEALLVEAEGELEQRIAARLENQPMIVAAAARALWGRSATDERERRAERRPRARQHISRELLAEIEAWVDERAKGARRRGKR